MMAVGGGGVGQFGEMDLVGIEKGIKLKKVLNFALSLY